MDSDTEIGALEASGWIVRGKGLPLVVLEAVKEDIAEKLELAKGDRLLDAGCGGMVYLNRLKELVSWSVGLDISFETLKRFKGENKAVCGELGSLPFRDDAFNKVLCNGVLVCLPDLGYVEKAIGELLRVCSPGGVILVSNILNAMLEREHRWNRYSIANLVYYLRNAHLFFKRSLLCSRKHDLLAVHPQFIKRLVDEKGHRCTLLLHVIDGEPGCRFRYDALIEKKR